MCEGFERIEYLCIILIYFSLITRPGFALGFAVVSLVTSFIFAINVLWLVLNENYIIYFPFSNSKLIVNFIDFCQYVQHITPPILLVTFSEFSDKI